MAPIVNKNSLKALVKEEIRRLLEEDPLDPRDAPGHLEHAKIERVLKRLMQHAEQDPAAGSEMVRRQDSETAWIMGYQSAVKRAAEELLNLYF